jgi:signal transduction histidine kinase/BarA-like signal transduction histidine kinase
VRRMPTTMRYIVATFVALSLFSFAQAPFAYADEPSETTSHNTLLVVGVPLGREPIFYQNADTGQIDGIGVDLMQAAARNAGYNVEFIAVGEKSLKEALDSDRYDLVMPFGSAITSASGLSTIVTENLFQTPFTFVTVGKKSLPSISTMRIGMLESLSGGAETLNQLYPEAKVTLYPTMDDCVNALRADEVDALGHNSYVWNYVLRKPAYSDLQALPVSSFTMDFRAGTLDTPKGREVVERLNGGIQKITDTQRQAIILDHTSRDLYKYDIFDTLYANRGLLAQLAIGITFVVVALIIWARLRRRYIKRLEASNSNLEKTNLALEKADASRAAFLSSMSHDMRTPLNGILGFLDLAKGSDNENERQDYIDKAITSADLMLALVNDVLDLSKVASSKMRLRPAVFDSEGLFEEIMGSIKVLAEEKDIEFSMTFSGKMPDYIYADRMRMEQIALNLLSNAVKYTPEGGKVECHVGYVASDANGGSTVLYVKDDGIGMSEEFQHIMFEPFTQEHSSRQYGAQGTGLGLSIVKQVVDLMDGTIEVESRLDHGTEFTVHIPIQAADSEGVQDSSTGDATSSDIDQLKGKRVLVVEDNDLNAEIAITLLRERAKIETERASNGKQAFDMFAESEIGYYDAILMDIRMPVMNGIDATCSIRALERRDAESVPIIAMTADAFAEDVQRCIDAGMNAHIVKPISPGKLIDTLATKLAK